MTTPQRPDLVIQARDSLVSDFQEFLTRDSLAHVEAVVDWLIGEDYLDEKYYEMTAKRYAQFNKSGRVFRDTDEDQI